MKKVFGILLALMLLSPVYCQDSVKVDSAWKFGGHFVFTMSHISYSNWAAGGENSYSGNSRLGLFANYNKGKLSWENNLDLAYGLTKQEDQHKIRKSDDIIEFTSKLGRKASNYWYYSVLFGAKTQFAEGRKYLDDDTSFTIVSKFISPINLNLAIGADYKPNEHTSLFLSLLNSKILYVSDDSLLTINSLNPDEHLNYELGFFAKFKYQKELIENLNFMTKLDVFADYLELVSIEDVDFSWEVLLTLKVFKALSVNFNTHIVWDNDVKSVNETTGEPGSAKIQFKEIFGAGLTYIF